MHFFRNFFLIGLSLFWLINAQAQEISCTLKNQELTEDILEQLADKNWDNKKAEYITPYIGELFLGTPYVGGTLEVNGMEEKLVVNMAELDCTTFLENAIVFTRLVQKQNLTFESFTRELQLLRYRDGSLNQYPSRLHYFTEWLANNEGKGIIENITKAIGGELYQKKFDFMSKHRESYPSLANDTFYTAIQKQEDMLNETHHYYIPQENIAGLEKAIQEGDLIAITTKIKGLDIAHVGLATWKNNRLHLLHASSTQKKVVVSKQPLAEYIMGNKSQSGIMVARLTPIE